MLSRLLLVTVSLFQFWTAEVQAIEPAVPQKDIERIALLICELGDDRYQVRQSATRALEQIGMPALKALRQAATRRDPEVRGRVLLLIDRIENGLDQLLADYRAFGLPLPPINASIVRFQKEPPKHIGTVSIDGEINNFTIEATSGLGFLLETADKKRRAKLLHGTALLRRDSDLVGPMIAPQPLTAKHLEQFQTSPEEALALALQMHALGWPVAEIVFEQVFKKHAENTPKTALRLLAWDYWNARLVDDEADYWPAAFPQMKSLLKQEQALDNHENRGILKSLEASLIPSKAVPGSMESLIDGLMDIRVCNFSNVVDDRCGCILDIGFEAVPILLKHLDDNRLTRCRERPQFFGSILQPEYHLRIRDVVSKILRSIAGPLLPNNGPRAPVTPMPRRSLRASGGTMPGIAAKKPTYLPTSCPR